MESPAKLIRWLFDSGSGPPNRLIPRWIVLRALAAQHPELGIDGLTGHETNPDTTGVPIPVLPDADF